MTNSANPRSALKKHGLSPSRKLGQNFLVNRKTAEFIVSLADFSTDDHIVEVGVGFGALTSCLAERVGKVTGIEFDKGIIRYHQEENDLADNVTLIHNDILKTDFSTLLPGHEKLIKIIANLPYSISNPFVFKLIENRKYIDRVVVMLQKEVADRLTAKPSTKSYGIPTVLLNGCADIKRLLLLKPAEFHPKPKIDSMVVAITFREEDRTNVLYPQFQTIVRASFGNRRKTLLNNLRSSGLFGTAGETDRTEIKNRAATLIEQAGLKPSIRAETLTIEQFWLLAGKYREISG